MKKLSQRMLALFLCVVMLAGYLGVIPSPVEPISVEAATATKPTNPNLLAQQNPDFEKVSDIEGWKVTDKNSVFLNDAVAKKGKLSLKIKDASNKGANSATSGKMPVAAGEVYYATASVNGTTHGTITVRFYDSADKEITAGKLSKTSTVANSKWETLNLKTTAPEGAVMADMQLSSTTAGVGGVYFDSAAFYAEPGPSQVKNSSFEGGYDLANNVPEDWTGWGGKTPLRQINTNLDYVKTGKQSLKLDVKFNAEGKNTTVGVRSSAVDAIVGSYYAFDFWVKAEPFTNNASYCYVYVNFTDINGNILDLKGNIIASNQFSYSQKVNVTTDWQYVRNGVTAPANATKVQVLFLTCSATASPTYVDDLKIELDKTVPVVPNPSFEEGVDKNGTPNGWSNYGGPYTDISIVTNEKTDGAHGVKIDNSVSEKFSGISLWLPVREGEQWKLTADKKGSVQIYLLYYTGNKSSRVSTHQAANGDKVENWKTVSVTATAESTSTGVPGMMQILIYTSGNTPSVSYVDNIKLERLKAAEIPTFSNKLVNGDFETRKTVTDWPNMSFDYIQTDEQAGGNRGNFVVKFVDKNEKAGAQFVSPQFSVTEPVQLPRTYQVRHSELSTSTHSP